MPPVQVLQIDGNTTEGWDGDRAAKFLRGTSGSSVMVKFARRSEQVPGVAGRPEQPPKIELKQVRPLLCAVVHVAMCEPKYRYSLMLDTNNVDLILVSISYVCCH